MKHYATTGLVRSIGQIRHKLRQRGNIDHECAIRLQRIERDESRIKGILGRDVRDLDILVVGHGPQLIEARYFARFNRVTGIDLDVVPMGFSLRSYASMLRRNGPGRFAKTVGRKLLGIDRNHANAWRRALQVERFSEPRVLVGDICDGPPAEAAFDLVVTWSAFQTIPDPAKALDSILRALRSGGAFFVGLHLYTSNTGHHDIRAFTGGASALPPWAHLRATTQDLVAPSAYLNQWRLSRWRELFSSATSELHEFREDYGQAAVVEHLDHVLRDELASFSDEELSTIDLFFGGRKSSPD